MPTTTKGAGKTGRPLNPLTEAQQAIWHRWQQHPASTRPPARTMAQHLGIGRDTFARRMREQGRGFSPAELLVIKISLDQF
jgi:hypothetical protein